MSRYIERLARQRAEQLAADVPQKLALELVEPVIVILATTIP